MAPAEADKDNGDEEEKEAEEREEEDGERKGEDNEERYDASGELRVQLNLSDFEISIVGEKRGRK